MPALLIYSTFGSNGAAGYGREDAGDPRWRAWPQPAMEIPTGPAM